MSAKAIAQEYVEYVKAGRFMEVLERLYAAEAVSVEAAAMPGNPRVAEGLEALYAKSRGFEAEHEVTGVEVRGMWPHGDEKFAVHMVFEMVHTPTQHRAVVDEIAVLTVEGGKIVKEEFFYAG